MQEEGCIIFSLLLAYLQQLSASVEDCRQLHTPQAPAALAEHGLLGSCPTAAMWLPAHLSADAWPSAQRQLSDLGLGTPFSLVLLLPL